MDFTALYQQRIRETYNSYSKELSEATTAAQRHTVRYWIYYFTRRAMGEDEFRGEVKKRDMMHELSKLMGISSHTLYVSIRAYKAYRYNGVPNKYALSAYNKLIKHDEAMSLDKETVSFKEQNKQTNFEINKGSTCVVG